MPRGVPTDPETLRTIRERLGRGEPMHTVAREVGVAYGVVYREKNGPPRPVVAADRLRPPPDGAPAVRVTVRVDVWLTARTLADAEDYALRRGVDLRRAALQELVALGLEAAAAGEAREARGGSDAG